MKPIFLLFLLFITNFAIAQTGQDKSVVNDTATHKLKEITIKEKLPAVMLKGDTTEYNAAAYKVNPDATAADLVRKMPAIEITGNKVNAQGETVIRVMVDGKTFFGEDAYKTLKTLPAEIIDKVQVYNEKSEQEKFTGFSEGATNKTINIVTKPNRRNGLFGDATVGAGSDNTDAKYTASTTLNQFKGQRRTTFTSQVDNVNSQNFAESQLNANSGSAGLTTAYTAGLSYSDKWGQKTDVNGSYFLNRTNGNTENAANTNYTQQSITGGQQYIENSRNKDGNFNNNLNLRLDHTIDSLNSIFWQPQVSLTSGKSDLTRDGNTYNGLSAVNITNNNSSSKLQNISAGSNILFRHRFHEKGRTFSINLLTNNYTNNSNVTLQSNNIYFASPLLNDSLKQKTFTDQQTWNISTNASYTHMKGKRGLLKVDYTFSTSPSKSEKNTFNYSETYANYSVLDSALSNSFNSQNTAHKLGGSYLYNMDKCSFSLGINYQYTILKSNNEWPFMPEFNKTYKNFLPVATFKYKLAKTKNINLSYNSSTHPPSVTQLQNVISNSDPLHLTTGNPSLTQPYTHNLDLRYNAIMKNGQKNVNAYISASYTQHAISTNVIIAERDTMLPQGILLPKGSQLTLPVNAGNNSSVNGNISYGMPLNFIKCRLSFSANVRVAKTPTIVNSQLNYQYNTNGGFAATLVSNISEKIDFLFSTNTSVVSNTNSLNKSLSNTYYNEYGNGSVNLRLPSNFIINTGFLFQINYGLAQSFNQNYFVWNMGVGKKIFRKQQGDLRITGIDLLNKNTNIQHIVTDTYIRDSRSNILQRYFMLTFSYRISNFNE